MNRNILNFANLILFIISLIFISNIIYDNFNQIKNTLGNLKYLNIYLLILLTIINTFFGNFLTYLLVKPFIKLKLNKFTEINLNSNLLNQLLPFLGTIYKGYIFKKFNFSYVNYINLILLTRILQIYFVFIFSLFLIIIFEEKLLLKIIILIAIIVQFLILIFLKSLKLNQKYFKNKYFQNIESFLSSFNLIKNKIFFIIVIMRITDFLIFYILVDNIILVEVKIIIIMYVLRFFIIHLPVIGSTTTAVVASTFAFSLMDLSFLDSFLINFLHSIIIVFGTIMCLLINYICKEYKN